MLIPILIGLAGLLLLVLLVILAYAIYIAHDITKVERIGVIGHPQNLDIPWEDVTFPSRGDGLTLSGWYLPADTDDLCIIMIQGTEHHRNSPEIRALRLGRDLVERGFSVLLFDFRARGESEGNRSSEGDREQWDVFGAIDYVTSRGIPIEHIGLLGFSLGAGVALLVAAQEPRIPAIVCDSGFTDYMMYLQKMKIGPFRPPYWLIIFIALVGRILFKADFSKVKPVEVVKQLTQPIFFIHGEDDKVVPVEETLALHKLSANPDDRIWIMPRTDHVNVYQNKPGLYAARVSFFFRQHII